MTGDFIHDPEGIVLFAEPTDVEVCSGAASSTATIRVLPFSARRDGGVFWAGPDTYHVPEDADYTIIEDLSPAEDDIEISGEEDEPVSLSSLMASG
jgi:hypothetical protein